MAIPRALPWAGMLFPFGLYSSRAISARSLPGKREYALMGNGIGMGFCGGFMWLFWILLIVVIVWVVKAAVGSSNNPPEKQKSALDILKERYARSEIDKEEFEQKRKDLSV
jgi:putative membrane protein